MKVAQVSEKVGFANVSYFCRSFREYYGSSPESYRKGTGEEDENTDCRKWINLRHEIPAQADDSSGRDSQSGADDPCLPLYSSRQT